jgi:cation-transporting ATPase I
MALPRLRDRRRVWTDHGHAFIEVDAIAEPEAGELRSRLQRRLERLDAVQWAEVNALTRRVAVAFEERMVGVADLVGVVDAVERDHGRHVAHDPDAPPHPADPEPLRRAIVAFAGDLAGLGLSGVHLVGAASPLPLELASLVTLLEHQPRLRRIVEHALGRRAVDAALPLLSALGYGVAHGPSGPLVDVLYRLALIGEIRARQQAWALREPELYANPRRRPVEPVEIPPRPVPLPGGPVGTWADRISIGALGGFAVTAVATGDPRRAVDAFLAGTPKAARFGREGFATQLGRILAARGVVPMEPKVLRRLDRLDTVVLDRSAVETGRWRLVEGPDDVRRRIEALWDPSDPEKPARKGRWRVAAVPARGTPAELRALRRDGALVLGLTAGGELRGHAAAVVELDPEAERVAEAVRGAGLMLVVAGRKGAAGPQLGAEKVCPRGRRLATAVRDLQADGAVVAVVTRRGRTPLVAADIGIGLVRRSGRPPWGADLICGHDLDDVTFLVSATVPARAVSRRSAVLALAGSGLGAAAALAGPPTNAAQRALLAVNGSAGVALATGAVTARRIGRPAPQPVPLVLRAGRAVPATASRAAGAGFAASAAALRLGARGASAIAALLSPR